MRPTTLRHLLLMILAVAVSAGAAPAPPSYYVVERTIGKIRADWAKPGSNSQPNASGWNALFDATLADLHTYTVARSEDDRLAALSRLYQISNGLASVGWAPAAELREGLREWLRPRVRLAWAERRLVDKIQGMPASTNPSVTGNRESWLQFVNNNLGQALHDYDGATTVAQRAKGLKNIYTALGALQTQNQTTPWWPSYELQNAVDDLFNRPNLDVSIDKNSLAPNFAVNLITTGPVYRKGYWSQVTAGPWLGFGLLPSDDGISFYNQQMLTSVTPITDFQKQIENNPQGKRAAKMYQFNAKQSDHAVLTITVTIRTSGMSISPSYNHNVNADISTTPQQGGGLGRAIASMMGFDQTAITKKTYDEAIGKIRSNVLKEAQEEAGERTAREAAQKNVQLHQYLIGNNRAMYRNLLIEGLSLRSRPENALIGGTIHYLNAKDQVGAAAPQPPEFDRPDAGVSADINLSSVMTNFTRGFLQSDAARDVQSLMIVTRKIAPNEPPSGGVKLTQNVDYPTFLKAVQTAQAANDPKVVAIRVKRPPTAPEFGVDTKGNLVALVNDFQIEVPVPPQAENSGALPPSKVLRLSSPQAEFAISFKVEPQTAKEPLRLTGRIESFDPGPNAKVYAINEDETKATPLNAFASILVLGGLRTKLQGQPIDVPLSNLQLRGFAITSVSPLDPSGWIRVNLVRTSSSPTAGIQ
jgi:hypothetical protein